MNIMLESQCSRRNQVGFPLHHLWPYIHCENVVLIITEERCCIVVVVVVVVAWVYVQV